MHKKVRLCWVCELFSEGLYVKYLPAPSPPLSPAGVPVPGTATLSHLCPSAHVPGEMDVPGCADPGLTTAMTNGRFRGRVMKCITRCQSSALSPRWQPAIIYSAYISLVFHSFAALNGINGGMRTLWRSCLHRVYCLSLTHLRRSFDDFFRRSIFDNKWCKENLIEHKNQEPLLTCERFWIKETSWWLLYNLTINWQ